MRYINQIKQLQLLRYNKVIDDVLAHIIYNLIKNTDGHKKVEILLLEQGDLLRGIDLLGINYSTGGIIGLKFLKINCVDKYIVGDYRYGEQNISLIVNREICDSEILGTFELYNEKV